MEEKDIVDNEEPIEANNSDEVNSEYIPTDVNEIIKDEDVDIENNVDTNDSDDSVATDNLNMENLVVEDNNTTKVGADDNVDNGSQDASSTVSAKKDNNFDEKSELKKDDTPVDKKEAGNGEANKNVNKNISQSAEKKDDKKDEKKEEEKKEDNTPIISAATGFTISAVLGVLTLIGFVNPILIALAIFFGVVATISAGVGIAKQVDKKLGGNKYKKGKLTKEERIDNKELRKQLSKDKKLNKQIIKEANRNEKLSKRQGKQTTANAEKNQDTNPTDNVKNPNENTQGLQLGLTKESAQLISEKIQTYNAQQTTENYNELVKTATSVLPSNFNSNNTDTANLPAEEKLVYQTIVNIVNNDTSIESISSRLESLENKESEEAYVIEEQFNELLQRRTNLISDLNSNVDAYINADKEVNDLESSSKTHTTPETQLIASNVTNDNPVSAIDDAFAKSFITPTTPAAQTANLTTQNSSINEITSIFDPNLDNESINNNTNPSFDAQTNQELVIISNYFVNNFTDYAEIDAYDENSKSQYEGLIDILNNCKSPVISPIARGVINSHSKLINVKNNYGTTVSENELEAITDDLKINLIESVKNLNSDICDMMFQSLSVNNILLTNLDNVLDTYEPSNEFKSTVPNEAFYNILRESLKSIPRANSNKFLQQFHNNADLIINTEYSSIKTEEQLAEVKQSLSELRHFTFTLLTYGFALQTEEINEQTTTQQSQTSDLSKSAINKDEFTQLVYAYNKNAPNLKYNDSTKMSDTALTNYNNLLEWVNINSELIEQNQDKFTIEEKYLIQKCYEIFKMKDNINNKQLQADELYERVTEINELSLKNITNNEYAEMAEQLLKELDGLAKDIKKLENALDQSKVTIYKASKNIINKSKDKTSSNVKNDGIER